MMGGYNSQQPGGWGTVGGYGQLQQTGGAAGYNQQPQYPGTGIMGTGATTGYDQNYNQQQGATGWSAPSYNQPQQQAWGPQGASAGYNPQQPQGASGYNQTPGYSPPGWQQQYTSGASSAPGYNAQQQIPPYNPQPQQNPGFVNQQIAPYNAQNQQQMQSPSVWPAQGTQPQQQMGGPQSASAPGALFGPQYVFQHVTRFLFRDHKASYGAKVRKATVVCNSDGSTAFSTRGSLSLSNKEVVMDASMQEVASLHKKMISMHKTWQIFRGGALRDHIADIKSGILDFKGMNVKVYLKGSSSPTLEIKGDYLGKSFSYLQGGRLVAVTQRQGKSASYANHVSGEDSFTLEVQPGVDTAFLCMVTMVLDDLLAGGKEPPPTAPTAGTTF